MADVDDLGNGVYRLTLARPITPGAATVITYLGDDSYVTYIAHPANVDGSLTSNANDITEWVQCWNNPGTCTPYQEDTDHSVITTLNDQITVIDLLNGAGEFDPWYGTPKPDPTQCEPESVPCGCTTPLCGAPEGNGESESDAGSERFAEGFVTFLTHVNLAGDMEAECFAKIVGGLCDMSFRVLSSAERESLAGRLLDAELTFNSPYVEFLVPDVAAFLRSTDPSPVLH